MPVAASIALAAVWFWAGISVAISGIETPIRTRMAEIPVQHYLAIGYRLFHTVNTLEWTLAAATLGGLWTVRRNIRAWRWLWLLTVCLTLVLTAQTVLLYGPLDARTLQRLQGTTLPNDNGHLFYIAAELVKFVLLVSIGTTLLARFRLNGPHPMPVNDEVCPASKTASQRNS